MALGGLVFVFTAAAPQLAPAQFLGRYSLSIDLTPDDLDRLNRASAELNEHMPVGTTERWENPQSGNRGTVALIGVHERDGLPCLKIRHNIKLKGVADPKVYIFDRCRRPDGSWKLY